MLPHWNAHQNLLSLNLEEMTWFGYDKDLWGAH